MLARAAAAVDAVARPATGVGERVTDVRVSDPSPTSGPAAVRLGIDLGGTKIAVAALGPDGAVVARRRTPTPQAYDAVLATVRDLAEAVDPGGATPLGVGMPGSVSPATGLVRNANLQALNGRDLRADLEAVVGRPVRLANDADCFTLSEARDGAGQGARIVFGVIVGTGVGGGVAVDGALIPGAGGIAGEWGHVPLPWPTPEESPGPTCWCGLHGCLERWVSGTGFAADYRRRPGADPALAAPGIVARAAAGEPPAVAALDAYIHRLGRGLALVCDILDPAAIVLGGGMSHVEALYARLPDAIAPWVFTDRPAASVLRNRHGDDSGVRGAAWLWSDPAPA